jgi:hypothetical protein
VTVPQPCGAFYWRLGTLSGLSISEFEGSHIEVLVRSMLIEGYRGFKSGFEVSGSRHQSSKVHCISDSWR